MADGKTLGRLPRFSTIGYSEKRNLAKAMKHELSGYLGGRVEAGYWCTRLADEWSKAFEVKYSIPCNSATSGLLAACMAAGIGPGTEVWTTAYSMSATAACAKVLGARIVFIDIETIRFSMNMNNFRGTPPKAIIVANLFGHPAYLSTMRSWCDSNKVVMIEDNAQSPFATENGKYAGTVGHMGVFSLNVHKHIQSGEGGVVVSNDANLAAAVRGAINHGELADGVAGLNLRMAEPIAAISCAQLAKAPWVISDRIAWAEEITAMFEGVPFVQPSIADVGCRHVYYMWTARVLNGQRHHLVKRLQDAGVPMREGYSPSLPSIFDKDQKCPTVDTMERSQLISFEVCAYDPRSQQRKKMKEIVRRACNDVAVVSSPSNRMRQGEGDGLRPD